MLAGSASFDSAVSGSTASVVDWFVSRAPTARYVWVNANPSGMVPPRRTATAGEQAPCTFRVAGGGLGPPRRLVDRSVLHRLGGPEVIDITTSACKRLRGRERRVRSALGSGSRGIRRVGGGGRGQSPRRCRPLSSSLLRRKGDRFGKCQGCPNAKQRSVRHMKRYWRALGGCRYRSAKCPFMVGVCGGPGSGCAS